MNSDAMEMLGGLLGNPDSLKKAADMIGSMSQQSGGSNSDEASFETDKQVPDISFLANLLSGNEISLQAMTKMKKAYDTFNNVRDPSINLINALSPYLSAHRAVNANKLITAVKVSKAINVFREE